MIKSLGLNRIRTEGKQIPANFYEQMDRAGILIDGGYQCCDAWQLQSSKLTSAHDYRIIALSARTIGENLRNHPSVLNFSWSDSAPTPRQERVSVHAFRAAGFQDPLISSAEYASAIHLGPSGEKEGPYDWVPPSYWYDTTHYDPKDSTRTNVGGAWGFDSESSSGATIPTLDSLKRFMSPAELHALWTKPNDNQYHLNYEKQLPNKRKNYGYAFGTLHDLDRVVLPARRRAARDGRGQAGARGRRGSPRVLERKRRHAVAGRVRDAARVLSPLGAARRHAGDQRVGLERGHDRRPRTDQADPAPATLTRPPARLTQSLPERGHQLRRGGRTA
jgi:hypothetical protein